MAETKALKKLAREAGQGEPFAREVKSVLLPPPRWQVLHACDLLCGDVPRPWVNGMV